eukprot:s2932_g5.t1
MNFIVNALERREVDGGMYQPVEDATRGRVLAGCYRPAMVTASIFHQAVRNGVDDAYTHPDALPPRLQSRERPPRRDPGRVPAAMMAPRSTTVEEELREGEDGRGRDRTPRRAQARALRNEHIMAEVGHYDGGANNLYDNWPAGLGHYDCDGGGDYYDTSGYFLVYLGIFFDHLLDYLDLHFADLRLLVQWYLLAVDCRYGPTSS